ncbi:hypothetical protein DB354_00840, partial [Opitutus sp. ER46]
MAQLQAEAAASDASSDTSLLRTLAVIGLQRAVHDDNYWRVISAITGIETASTGSIWFYHARGTNWWVDGHANYSSVRIRASALDYGAVWESTVPWMNATEHLCLEEVSDGAGVSTGAVLESALRSGKKILRLTPSNLGSVLPTIAGGVLPGVVEHVTAGNIAFVTSERVIPISDGNGLEGGGAFLPIMPTPNDGWLGWAHSGAWAIQNGFNGGGKDNVTSAPSQAAQNSVTVSDPVTQHTAADPVDLYTGAFLYDGPSLKVGNGEAPMALDYRPHYSTNWRLQNTAKIGYGWTHSYDIYATERHASDVDIRTASIAEIAPYWVTAQYLLDTVTKIPTAKEVALRVIAARWASRQVLKAKVTVALGQRRIEFHRLSDGSYMSPSRFRVALEKSPEGVFTASFKHGNSIEFDGPNAHASKIVDQYGNECTFAYADNGLASVTDAYNRTLTFGYTLGALSSVTDSTGRSVAYSRGSTFDMTDADGGVLSFEMDTYGHQEILSVRDGLDRVVVVNLYDIFHRVWAQQPLGDALKPTYFGYAPGRAHEADAWKNTSWTTFDSRGRRVQTVDMLGNVATWVYDGADRVVATTTAAGRTRAYGYNSSHLLTSETDGEGNTRAIVYDAEEHPWKVGNFEGKQTVYTYTAEHAVKTIKQPGNIVTEYTYDALGRLDTVHRPQYDSGEVDTYSYDSYGNIDKITYPMDGFEDLKYNIRGDLEESIDRNNVKISYEYNNRRMCTSVSQWDGTTEYKRQTIYDAAGDVDYTLDASARKRDFSYDALGNLLEIREGPSSAQVSVLTNTYEERRHILWKRTNALNATTTLVRDLAQRVVGEYDPLNRYTEQWYDKDGMPSTRWTPLRIGTTNAYDGNGRVTGVGVGVSESNLKTYTVDYDKDGRRVSLSNRLETAGATTLTHTFTWLYDDDAREIKLRTPLLKTTTTTLSTRGLLLSVKEPSDQVCTYGTYDLEGRVTERTDGVGVTSYTYWPNGLLKEVTEAGKTTYREYDNLNRLKEYRDGEGNTLTYEYYGSGELWKLHYPGGKTVTYAYDDFGRLKTVTDWASRVTTYTYDDAGQVTGVAYPNGTSRSNTYDAAGQLTRIEHNKADGTRLVYEDLRYDADGRVESLFLHPKPAAFSLPTDALEYDADNQLSKWNNQTVICDADGNMTTGPSPSGAMKTYSYDARNR